MNENNKVRLVFFPYSGGGASVYKRWERYFNDSIELYYVSLPGREARIKEPQLGCLGDYTEHILSQLLNLEPRKTFLFGHSIGGMLAFSVAQELEKMNENFVKGVFISSFHSPQIFKKSILEQGENDDDLIAHLKEIGGTPREIINNDKMLRLILPILKSDLRILHCVNQIIDPIASSLITYAGCHDSIAPSKDVTGWNKFTKSKYHHKEFKGSHFFLWESETEVVNDIKKRIHRELI